MTEIFLKIVNMSISASYIVLAVLLVRLLLKRAPKWITVALWGIVALRLVCPFTVESVLSLIPSAETISPDIMTDAAPQIDTGIPIVNQVLNPVIHHAFTPDPTTSANPLQVVLPVLAAVWLLGMLGFLIYTVISYVRVKRKVVSAVLLRDNIYQSESVVSPFLLGFIRPRIYLPFHISEQDMEHVVAHEMAHIRRRDYIWKPLGFALLALHWFNPLLWLGYVLLCRDIELACDETVIKGFDRDARADYSQALLNCSVNRRMIAACPLAFGEVSVKDRVRSVLNYKKPAFWIIVAAVVLCVVVAVCFLTSPVIDSGISIRKLTWKGINTGYLGVDVSYGLASGKYSVRYVPEDEGEYCGDGMVDYDGVLGQYRIMIQFFDTEPTKSLAKKCPVGEVVQLENTPIPVKVKRVHPQDHGFVLYLGFDDPVYVDTIDEDKLNWLGGKITIPLFFSSLNDEGIFDTATFDVDGDGRDEICTISLGPTSGMSTICFTALDAHSKLEKYNTVIYLQYSHVITFVKCADGVVRLRCVTQDYEIKWYDMTIDDNNAVLLTDYVGSSGTVVQGVFYQRVSEVFGTDYSKKVIYESPLLSSFLNISSVPTLGIDGNQLFSVDEKGKTVLGTLRKISLNKDNFDEYFCQGHGFDFSQKAENLRKENAVTYEVIPTGNNTSLFYIMQQINGDILLVFGNYNSGEKNEVFHRIYFATTIQEPLKIS